MLDDLKLTTNDYNYGQSTSHILSFVEILLTPNSYILHLLSLRRATLSAHLEETWS